MTSNPPLQNGDDLEKVFLKWHKEIFRYAILRLNDKQLAEDITQEVFIKAWRYRENFDPEKSSIKNWLYIIVTNLIRDHYRVNEKKKSENLNENIPDKTNIKADFDQDTLIKYLYQKLSQLSQRDQEIIILKYKEGFPLKEIATILNIEYNAAKVALHRATKKLQALCEDRETALSQLV